VRLEGLGELKKIQKVNLFLCLISYAISPECNKWRGGIAPTFLSSALDGGEWSASRTLYPLDRMLGGPQSRSGSCGNEKNHALPEFETWSSNPQLVAISTELSWLLILTCILEKQVTKKYSSEGPAYEI
jgi:hypothetical protein